MLDQDKPSREPRLDDNVFSLLNLAWLGQAAFVVAKLGVADLLLSGPKTIEELAQSTETDPTRLHQVMRALAGFEIFAVDGEGRYRLTLKAHSLTRGAFRGFATTHWVGENSFTPRAARCSRC